MAQRENGRAAQELSWERCAEAFHDDGALRDIYVPRTGPADWDRFLAFVRSSDWAWTYEGNSSQTLCPESSREAFPEGDHESTLLAIDLGSTIANCHFIWVEDIELDIDPRDIDSQEAMDQVLDFVLRLGRCLEKEVVVTHESGPSCVWFRYDPANDSITYHGGARLRTSPWRSFLSRWRGHGGAE